MKKFVSIDVSSKTLDICIKEGSLKTFNVINNEVKAIRLFFKKLNSENIIVAMENTGRYNLPLYEGLIGFKGKVYVIAPLQLKKSLGLVRGKNDKIDAERIAWYIEKHHEDLTQWKPVSSSIKKLRIFLTERASRLKISKQLKAQNKEYRLLKNTGLDKQLIALNKGLLKNIETQINQIEKEIEGLIKNDVELKNSYELIQSVPGVGKVLSWNLLSKTENFSTVNSPRKLACYCGVAPFEYQSGSSIYRKPKVSVYADKTLKSLLHMGALAAVRIKNDLSEYYMRKLAEGKNKMSVLNAVRNKIIHRVFSVLKNQKMYQFDLVLS